MNPRRPIILLLVLTTLCGCGSDAPPQASVATGPQVVATGAVTATYPAPSLTPCHNQNGNLSVALPAQGDTSKPLQITIRGYHGAATYSDMLGPAADSGTTVEIDNSAGDQWVASGGAVVVTLAAYTRINGTISVTLEPHGGSAAGTVAVSGTWTCSLVTATATPAA